jgi:uroporphyrinogen decarboxylase
MCMTPELAVEVTLQPIRRFDFDAAIIFSDILVIPFALGQPVRFEEGSGPVLGPYDGVGGLSRSRDSWVEKLAPVYDAVSRARAKLSRNKALIGFAGAPWTLAAYMLQGRGSADQRLAKSAAYCDRPGFSRLMDLLVDAVTFHLVAQLQAGADAVQLFDSWAGGLPDSEFDAWVIGPAARIVSKVRGQVANARIIGFPRAVTQNQYERYVESTGVSGVGFDPATSMDWAAKTLGVKVAVQGNLDPIVLVCGGEALDKAVDELVRATSSVPFIFNLGHGVLPETPLDNVLRAVERVRGAV